MDAFYASVEQRDDPSLRGKPIAVGGGGKRGVTTTASYEARAYGVKSAMPGYLAKQLCPQLIFVRPRFDVYQEVSREVRSIFEEYTELIEPLSLDEAFLDVTTNKLGITYGVDVAKEIIKKVKIKTGLGCSAGVSYCKFLAKIASGMNKPNGLTLIKPEHAESFLESLEVKEFFGVGKVTAAKMKRLGIENGYDLKQFSKIELASNFGKTGAFFYDIVRGIDNRPVKANRIRKSIGFERTFESDLEDFESIADILNSISEKLFKRLLKAQNFGRTITLKVKDAEFKTMNRSVSKSYFIKDQKEIKRIGFELLEKNAKFFGKIRLIGLTASNLEKEVIDDHHQLELDFESE